MCIGPLLSGCGEEKVVLDFVQFTLDDFRYTQRGGATYIADVSLETPGFMKITLPGVNVGDLGFQVPEPGARPASLQYSILGNDSLVFAFYNSKIEADTFDTREFGGSGTVSIVYTECLGSSGQPSECIMEGSFDFEVFNSNQESKLIRGGRFRITQILQ